MWGFFKRVTEGGDKASADAPATEPNSGDASAPATTVWRSQTVAAKAEDTPAPADTAGTAKSVEAPAKSSDDATAPKESHVDAAEGTEAVTTEAAASAPTEEKKKKPVLISRKADFNVAEMMRQLREGEVAPAVQPKVKTTSVVKKEKPSQQQQQHGVGRKPVMPPAMTQRAEPGAAPDKKRRPQPQGKGTTTVVVVTTGEAESADTEKQTKHTPATAAAKTSYAAKVKGTAQRKEEAHPPAPQENEADRAAAATEPPLEDGMKTPPPRPVVHGKGHKGSAKASPVKQGSVQKRAKKATKAADDADAPAPQVTTVKAKMSIEELRALRNRGNAMAAAMEADPSHASSAAATGTATVNAAEARVIDEISSLLLRYCAGGASQSQSQSQGATAGKNLDPKAWPTLGDGASAAPAPKEASAAAAADTVKATEKADASAAALTPEVELYNRLTELCDDENVTASTLDLIHELLKHTRVIPVRSQAATDTADADDAKADKSEDAEAIAQAEALSQRRLYAQQIVFVLINKMKQKKLMEEQRRQLRELQQQRPLSVAGVSAGTSSTTGTKLSAFSAPFVPASVAAAGGPAASRVTTFAPQSTASTGNSPAVTAGRIPSLASGSAAPAAPSTTPTTTTAAAAAAAAAATVEDVVSGPVERQLYPSNGGHPHEDDLKSFQDALRNRLVLSTTEPTVSISADERRVLREIRQSFMQQQQQQHASAVETGASPASTATSSKAVSFTFDANQAASPSATVTTTADAESSRGSHPSAPTSWQRPANAGVNRTVFTYKTLVYDPSSSSAEDVTGLGGPSTTSFNRNAKPFVPGAASSSVAAAAAPTTVAATSVGKPAAMNAAAPAFVPRSAAAASAATAPATAKASETAGPSARPAAPRGPAAAATQRTSSNSNPSHARGGAPVPPAPQQPWASPEMFAQWKKAMEEYYRSMTYSDFAAAMQQQQQ